MDFAYFQILIFAIAAIVGFYASKRYENKDYFWLGILGLAGLVLRSWSLYTTKYLDLQPTLRLVNSGIILILWIGFFALLIKIAFWGSKKIDKQSKESL
jgi:hypothetical protein